MYWVWIRERLERSADLDLDSDLSLDLRFDLGVLFIESMHYQVIWPLAVSHQFINHLLRRWYTFLNRPAVSSSFLLRYFYQFDLFDFVQFLHLDHSLSNFPRCGSLVLRGKDVGLMNQEGFRFRELSLNLDFVLGLSVIFGGIFFLYFSGCVSASASWVYSFSVLSSFFLRMGTCCSV